MRRLAFLLMTLPLFMACQSQGPFERTGKKVDTAVRDLKVGGKKAGTKIGDAAKDIGGGVKDAAEDIKKN